MFDINLIRKFFKWFFFFWFYFFVMFGIVFDVVNIEVICYWCCYGKWIWNFYVLFWFEILIVLVIFWIFEVVFVILKNKFYLKKIYSNVNSCYEDLINVYYLFNLKLM